MKMQRNIPTKSRTRRRWVLAIALGAMTPVAGLLSQASADEEFGSNTPYYEDDAWYDVSEWFDGNDYNPTDEAIGRWDGETYGTSDALVSSDGDNDINWSDSDYGYFADNNAANSDANWFYDYYDYGYTDFGDYNNDGTWDYTATYYDYDKDGVYDSVSEYVDTDRDGVYETYNYVTFSDPNTDQDPKNQMKSQSDQKSRSSQVVMRQGSIKSAKKVKTPHGTNIVVALTDTKKGDNVIVDLGSADQYDTMPRLGQDIAVEGTTFKAGEKSVLLASKVTRDDKKQMIDRSGREFTGTVDDLKTMKVRGKTHQFARIMTDNNKKLLVDMGQQDKLKLDVKKGSKVSVTGPAVKVKDRVMLIAREISSNGKSVEVERMALTQ